MFRYISHTCHLTFCKSFKVCAGGVHSVLLTKDGTVYTCGINEKGTVPAVGVDPEESTDEFTKIQFSPEISRFGKVNIFNILLLYVEIYFLDYHGCLRC